MKRIRMAPNPSGAYPPIQEGSFETIPEDMALWPDELSTETFYAHNGFVVLSFEEVSEVVDMRSVVGEDGKECAEPVYNSYNKVADCQPNTELYEAWVAEEAKKAAEAEAIEEEPTQLDRVEAQATYTAMMTDTLLEV